MILLLFEREGAQAEVMLPEVTAVVAVVTAQVDVPNAP